MKNILMMIIASVGLLVAVPKTGSVDGIEEKGKRRVTFQLDTETTPLLAPKAKEVVQYLDKENAFEGLEAIKADLLDLVNGRGAYCTVYSGIVRQVLDKNKSEVLFLDIDQYEDGIVFKKGLSTQEKMELLIQIKKDIYDEHEAYGVEITDCGKSRLRER